MGCNTKGVRGRKRKTTKNDIQNQFSCPISTLSLKLTTKRNISDSLLRRALLVNISLEFDDIWGSYGQETFQKQPKMIYSMIQIRHKWNLTQIYTTLIPFIYLKIRVVIDGPLVGEGGGRKGTYKKPATHVTNLTIFLYFNMT